jgi:hypothetical protein
MQLQTLTMHSATHHDDVTQSSDQAFTEHYYLTFASRGSNTDEKQNYYEIGAHYKGKHQHYEENCCEGGVYGEGQYETVKKKSKMKES